MNVADNQTQNLNYNPHNPNLTNPGSKKFARDYDKEPLVIKDYNPDVTSVWTIFVFVFAIIAVIVADISAHAMGIMAITMMIWVSKSDMEYSKNSDFKFTNSSVSHSTDRFYKEIKLNGILKIEKTMQAFYEVHDKKVKNDKMQKVGNIALILYILLLIAGLVIIDEDKTPIICMFAVFISGLIFPQYFYHLKTDKELKDKFYDTIIISSKNFNICIFLAKKSDYERIRQYFLNKRFFDIDKARKILF